MKTHGIDPPEAGWPSLAGRHFHILCAGSVTTVAPHWRAIFRGAVEGSVVGHNDLDIQPRRDAVRAWWAMAGSSLSAGMIRTAFATEAPFMGIIGFHRNFAWRVGMEEEQVNNPPGRGRESHLSRVLASGLGSLGPVRGHSHRLHLPAGKGRRHQHDAFLFTDQETDLHQQVYLSLRNRQHRARRHGGFSGSRWTRPSRTSSV